MNDERFIIKHIDPVRIKDYVFTYEDYETLFPANQKRNDTVIAKKRKSIQKKLLNIHSKIKNFAQKADLHVHWNPEHITTIINPTTYNNYTIAWVGIRYGKHRKHVKYGGESYASFTKHGSIQIGLYPGGFTVSLFHAVRDGAIDRGFVQEKLFQNPDFKNEMLMELQKIKGKGYTWYINDPIERLEPVKPFSLDNRDLNEFFKFYKFDNEGFESHLTRVVPIDDISISTEDQMVFLIKDEIKNLLPLYKQLIYIPPVF
ncbi:hypothetical protein ABES03_10280 [Neobacillus rhizosphaerae]|uniref:hypothetical protein n=1 Tax=Neobacillus rhizosphaerae TaxID=2880965 RepID=UPI003D2987D0